MNPPTEPQPEPRKVQDIKPSANTEVVSNIPVQSPVSKVFKPSAEQAPAPRNDNELDHVLKDASASVMQADKPAGTKENKAQPKMSGGTPRPIAATIAACLVALVLIAAAVMVYR